MFSFFYKTKHKEEISVIFAIESGKVIASIVHFSENLPPAFLYSHRQNITYQQDVNPQRLEDLMLSALKVASDKLGKDGASFLSRRIGKIKVYVFLGSPWYLSIHSKTEKNSPKPFLVTEDLIKNTAKEEFKNPHEDTRIIEQKILSVKGNGYSLQNPNNQKTDNLCIEFLTSIVSTELIAEIENMITLSIAHVDFEYHTTPQAIFPVARELIGKKDFVIFIPEHEISDLIVVRDGHIEKTISIPFGKHSPTRGLATVFKGEKTDAHALIMLFLGGELEKEKEAKVRELINLSKNKFQEIFRDALWQLSSTIFIPQDIVVADGHPISKLLGEWIQNEEFSNKTMSSKSFNVYFMQNKDIINKISYEKTAEYLNPLLISIGLYLKSLSS